MSTTELQQLIGTASEQAGDLLRELREDRSRLPVVFPGLPRRFGRDGVGGGPRRIGEATVDLDAFRRCDLTAAFLLGSIGPKDEELADLFAHGDIEERAMLLRSLSFLPLGSRTRWLLGEVLRTNVVLHLEAALCDSDLLARSIAAGAIDTDTGNRLLLKFAFLDLPLVRALHADGCANPELSRMLQDLATEREAAGRAVWRDTWRMLGKAPCPGALARLIGGLEHGDDGVRLAAADGLLALSTASPGSRTAIAPFATERLPREPRPAVRERLEQLADLQ